MGQRSGSEGITGAGLADLFETLAENPPSRLECRNPSGNREFLAHSRSYALQHDFLDTPSAIARLRVEGSLLSQRYVLEYL